MNNILHSVGQHLVIAFLVGLVTSGVIAQGPPISIDTCIVTSKMRLKTMPLPSKFNPTDYEALRACANLGNNVVKVSKTKIGKVGNLNMQMRFTDGKLVQVWITSNGEKEFKKLYKQVILEAGIPNKMVESRGVLTYSWGVRSKIKAELSLHYTLTTTVGMVSILP